MAKWSGRKRASSSKFHDILRASFNSGKVAVTRGRSGLTIVAIALAIFTLLFVVVRRNRTAATDAAITLRLQKQNHPYFDRVMHIVSWPGFPPQSRLLPPSISAVLWMLGFRLEAFFQLAAWGTGGISFVVKRAMRRSRPGPDSPQIRVVVANIGGSSFPSGHVLNYMGVYGFLAYLAYTWIRPTIARRVVVGMLSGLLGLVGPSRIYLGHHWFTDVFASYLLGTSYLIGITSLYRHVRLRVRRYR